MPTEDEIDRAIFELGREPRLAHQMLFAHRHPDTTPDFHYEMIDDLHGPAARVLELAFRGAGKSTIAEEYIAVGACLRQFRNFIIVGESFTRAAERLAAVKHEIDFNDTLNDLFGSLHGPTWNEDKIVLSNGVVIQAFGRGQSLRGTKHDDVRPDGCLIDDIEDEESVNTPEGRDKVQRWVMRTLLPALAPGAKIRMLANMLDPDCLAVRLRKSGLWLVREYPWEYVDLETGERRPTWEARFPLKYIDTVRQEYERAGLLNEYMQEYMVQAIDPSTRVFKSEMFRTHARVRTWEPVYAIYDPARTAHKKSAHTGKIVCSWVGSKLVVWEAEGNLWLPDQIIDDIFAVQETYAPVYIGVEATGLEEFIMQPLRQRMVQRAQIIPVKKLIAPVGKDNFISSLQPFFTAGQVEFVKEFPTLQEQLLSFPTGRKDVPNALAYAPRMRPGLPIYDNFGFKNVIDELPLLRDHGCFLALGATRQYTSGVLCQVAGERLRVVADWIREGDPGSVLNDIISEVRLRIGSNSLTVFAGREHWNTYDTIGLQAAARRAGIRMSAGGEPAEGREQIRKKIDGMTKEFPNFLVSSRARWTLNAMAGGYAAEVKTGKEVMQVADSGMYKVLAEGLEAFAAVGALAGDGLSEGNYAIDSRGRRYLSAMPGHHAPEETKL